MNDHAVAQIPKPEDCQQIRDTLDFAMECCDKCHNGCARPNEIGGTLNIVTKKGQVKTVCCRIKTVANGYMRCGELP